MKSKKIISWLVQHDRVSLVVIGVLFSTIVLGNITRWSIWFDEAFSAYLTRFSYGDIVFFTSVDVHPPLYYLVLKAWISIFGTSELSYRGMSLFFALIALGGMYVLIQKLFKTKWFALLAVFLTALSPLFVRFSEETRMYTMVAAIVIWATYVMLVAMEKRKRRYWIIYGVLLSVGMWTHYFTALLWIAHWVWRAIEQRNGTVKRFWTTEWIGAHVLAVALYFAWIPVVFNQFKGVMSGFWIPPVDLATPIDYIATLLLYLQSDEADGWWAILFWTISAVLLWVIIRARRYIAKESRSAHRLLVVMAIVPPVLLVLLSLPPLRSSFVDRYLLSASLFTAALIAYYFCLLIQNKVRGAKVALSMLIATFVVGIGWVYYYGNYNHVSHVSIRSKDVLQLIYEQGKPGEPIIAANPWIYYEAAFYDDTDHHVYFVDLDKYNWGSLRMLKDTNIGKISNLEKFTATHRYVWYFTNTDKVEPPVATWKKIKQVNAYDYIDNDVRYRAALFDTQPTSE